MAQDKQLARIEAKLDALLEESGLKPEDYAAPVTTGARAPRTLTAAEQQAIDNAPKTPVGANGPAATTPRVDQATNAPSTAASVPPDAVGQATVVTQQPDGTTTTQTVPASELKGGEQPWEGYDTQNRDAILARLRDSDDATRQRVLTYERANKKRETVIQPLVNWNS